MTPNGQLVRGELFVVLEDGNDNLRSVCSWSPTFPSVFGEGATERLSLLSLRKGIELYLEPEKPEKAAQKHITLKPYTAEEKKQILEKWRQDCEGPSTTRSEEEVVKAYTKSLCLSCPTPAKPAYLRKRRRNGRTTNLLDYTRPVETAKEKSLFLEGYAKHTKNQKTDWTAFVRDFNNEVVKMWESNEALSDVYLKEERHLKTFEKALVVHIGSMETARIERSIQNLARAQGSSVQATAQRAVAHPFFSEVQQSEGKGKGRGGGSKSCHNCTEVLKADLGRRVVPKLGHSCVLAMIYAGKDAASLPHCSQQYQAAVHDGMSRQEAEDQLRAKLNLALREKDRKRRRGTGST